MMDEKLDWTTELGQAFVAQPDDVYNSCSGFGPGPVGRQPEGQPAKTVIVERIIKIMPADPTIIYRAPIFPQVRVCPATGHGCGAWSSRSESVSRWESGSTTN